MLEDRLHQAFGKVWADLLDNPQAEPREALLRHLEPLRARVQRVINS
jgi:hypothetical protein